VDTLNLGHFARGRGPDGPSQQVQTPPACASCNSPLPTTRGRQRYCNHACRQRAYRNRHDRPGDAVIESSPTRRSSSLYQCPDCDSRYVTSIAARTATCSAPDSAPAVPAPAATSRSTSTNSSTPDILQPGRNNVLSTQAGQLQPSRSAAACDDAATFLAATAWASGVARRRPAQRHAIAGPPRRGPGRFLCTTSYP